MKDEQPGDAEKDEEQKEDSSIDGDDPAEGPTEGSQAAEETQEAAPTEKRFAGLTSDHYLGGSAIAFSLGTLLMLTVGWGLQLAGVEMTVPVILAINVVPTMIGSMISTFLFTRRSRRNYVLDGVKFGIGGFLITFLYTSLLGQGVGGAYILTGFLIGGILGGFITKKIYEKP